MNLVGPRAYMVQELDVNDEVTKTILRVRPGVTGWWQVTGRNEATFSDRQKLDLYYITNWSLWVDYYILIKTIWIILSGKGK
jgi:lipopolysaccharide/colanic/teichoic acid biosynthesis glycosyltransferase